MADHSNTFKSLRPIYKESYSDQGDDRKKARRKKLEELSWKDKAMKEFQDKAKKYGK